LDIGQVAKFSYFKKLLVPRVGVVIDGLPFKREGYTQAKNILMTESEKPREVPDAYIQYII